MRKEKALLFKNIRSKITWLEDEIEKLHKTEKEVEKNIEILKELSERNIIEGNRNYL